MLESERISYKTSDVSVLSRQAQSVKSEEVKSEYEEEDKPIKWINIIFIPFHFWWQTIVLYVVCVKCFFGPLKAVLPFLTCSTEVDKSIILVTLKVSYIYISDVVYIFDTFLYIVHRQVTDEAMKREFLPKSAFLILIDVLSLIPFYGMFQTSECKSKKSFWPNMLTFSELLVIYRVGKYFSLNISHNCFQLLLGYSVMFVLVLNATTCFVLLSTIHGLCNQCAIPENWRYDWRAFKFSDKLLKIEHNLEFYIHACEYVFALLVNYSIDDTRPRTYTEYILSIFLLLLGYFTVIFVIMPKLFAENILRLRAIYSFHPRAKRIIEETKRRNRSPSAYHSLERFYSVIWKMRDGITAIPKAIKVLPLCIRIEIMHDLIWPVFYHSPTLRHVSRPFKRWISRYATIKYKLPGERFFAGLHCFTDLHYIKTGVVQIVSGDDSVAPMLSVDGGTVLGDISFFVPPIKRQIIARCLTYCQVISIPRAVFLRALHKFPEDRRKILTLVRQRLAHARILYECKQEVKDLDRADDEGIIWIKQRWWEINKLFKDYKKSSRKHTFKLPPDDEYYHCAKYIGQLVLCDEQKLKKESIFVKVKFPFILTPRSSFALIWHRIVMTTIYFVLFVYPPNLMRQSISKAPEFEYISDVVDLIYTLDIIISAMTAEESDERLETNLGLVIYERIKKKQFILDFISTVWFEELLKLLIGASYAGLISFNRLIKTYLLFYNKYNKTWNRNRDPLRPILYSLLLSSFCYVYIFPYMQFVSVVTTPLKEKMAVIKNFGYLCSEFFIKTNITTSRQCTKSHVSYGILEVLIGWLIKRLIVALNEINTVYDNFSNNMVLLITILFFLYHKMRIISTLYLKHAERINYQCFVSNLKRHYIKMKIHPTLLKRLDNYLGCHWKYYHGSDIIHPNLLRDEPYDVYWKLHGEIAESVISQSSAFNGADPELIRELALRSKFLILPKDSTFVVFGTQTDKVTWVFHGYLRSVFHNDKGEIVNVFAPKGNIISMGSVFLGRTSLKTYIAESDVEEEFNRILKRYPEESSFFQKCKDEFTPVFDEMYVAYFKKFRDYTRKQKLQETEQKKKKLRVGEEVIRKISSQSSKFFKEFRTNPESKIIRFWMTFRVFILFMSLTLRPSYYMSERMGLTILRFIIYFTDAITVIDIIIKMFVPYYDERGLIVYAVRKCAFHYFTRGFLADVTGCLFGFEANIHLLVTNQNIALSVMENIFPYLHMYLLNGYFNYLADEPSANTSLLMISKWFLMLIPISTTAIRTLFWICIDKIPDGDYSKVKIKSQCWLPTQYTIWESKPNFETIHLIIASAANTILTFYLNHGVEKTSLMRFDYVVYVAFLRIALKIMFWFITCYFLTLFILKYRGDSMFEHGVGQLKSFLKGERIDNKVINRALDYFSYWRRRTSGVNMKVLLNERIGAIFRQDLNYYFFKKTLQATDGLLHGGDILKRKLAYYTSESFFLSGEDIMREKDLCPHLFIVHRGQVELSSEGKRLAMLTKGSIFGQLSDVKLRPIYITAKAVQNADVLVITVKDFHEVINDTVRQAIAKSPTSKNDYMKLKKPVEESPYNSIEYILRGNKAIQFPYMKKVIRADQSIWYSRWLLCALVVNPMLCTAFTLLRASLPQKNIISRYYFVTLFLANDVIHLIHIVTEFFTMQLTVVIINDFATCVYKYRILRKFKDWRFYADVISLFVPYIFWFTGSTIYLQARLLRIHAVFLYYRLFCSSFKARKRSNVIKFAMFMLFIHTLVCVHILVGCRSYTGKNFPAHLFPMTKLEKSTIDTSSWKEMQLVREPACHVNSMPFVVNSTHGNLLVHGFLAPTSWLADYIIALTFVIIILTAMNYNMISPVTAGEIYYRIFLKILAYFIKLWFASFVISSVYTKYSEMYSFDYQVLTLLNYLKRNGVSKVLRASSLRYTKLLWLRTSGYWLPKITHNTPQCLCEDILGALYMHHIMAPHIFNKLPHYFLRQMAVRLSRMVVFPGKIVVEAGDINPCIYFIHEGEVEKWYTDANGDQKLLSVLTTNGYFGLIPGLFPNTPYVFTYSTRTVVEFVYLANKSWLDLLDGYPDIKSEIYTAAKKLAYKNEAISALGSKHSQLSQVSHNSLKSMN